MSRIPADGDGFTPGTAVDQAPENIRRASAAELKTISRRCLPETIFPFPNSSAAMRAHIRARTNSTDMPDEIIASLSESTPAVMCNSLSALPDHH